jgi:hypothetical protein
MAVKQFGKKGMFLTFIAISLVAALIIIFTPSGLDLSKDIPVIKTRVSNLNSYVTDLENVYLESTLQVTGRKTIISLILYVNNTQEFLTDFETDFTEVLLSGTINSIPIDDITGQDIMKDSTYPDWINRIINTSKNAFNVDTSFSINDIQVYQITPWSVNVDANLSFNVSSETASWDKENILISTKINIENLNDPYYLVNTGGSYTNNIKKTGTKFDEWDVEKVKDFIRDGNYTHWENSQAPSFLMRFTNDISPSPCCGIESIVNPNNPAVSDKDVSYADFLYWSTTADCDNLNLYTIDGISLGGDEFPGLKLDTSHVALYNLLDEAQQVCPPPE